MHINKLTGINGIFKQHYSILDDDGRIEDIYKSYKDMTQLYIKRNEDGHIILIADVDYQSVSIEHHTYYTNNNFIVNTKMY